MKDVKLIIEDKLNEILKGLGVVDIQAALEKPKDETKGDYASNIAMQLAKTLQKSPMQIAQDMVAQIGEIENVDEIEVAAPGFINFKINKATYKEIINDILDRKENFGKSEIGKGKRIMVEFGQPNTHKAFHVGHLKSAISGLSMVRLHENLGYDVIKANYFGDVGMQVAKPTWAFMQKGKPEDFDNWEVHEQMKYIDDCYAYGSQQFKENKDVESQIRKLNLDIYANADTEEVRMYKYLREISLKHQAGVWQSLGIVYDREYPESEVYKDALKIVDKYKDSILEESEGALIYRGEKVGLTNWVFLTSEGNPTYSSKDLALASKKFEEYPDLFKGIVTTSVEIADYFKVVIHVLNIIKPETKGRYFHIPFGWMLRGGKKFSSRMGGSIKGMDILNEVKEVAKSKVSELKDYSDEEKESISHNVALSGLKFLILSHEFRSDISYDPNQFLSFEGFSGPYILYSYARAKSIIGKANMDIGQIMTKSDEILNNVLEINLLKELSSYADVALRAGEEISPHFVANYLYELSQKFNQFYTNCRVLNAETEADKMARLKLTAATAQVLKNGLNLLGIETVEKM